MIWLLYNILFAVGFILLLPRFIYRMCRRGGYAKHIWQRAGIYRGETLEKLQQGGRIWLQAVSVGELFIAFRFIEELRARRPGLRFVISTNTSTGHRLAGERMAAEDVLLYFPVDLPFVMKRVLRIIRPAALILIECELWPNLIRLARRRGIPVLLVNGRISDHSYRGYRSLRLFTRRLLRLPDLLCVQTEGDREKLAYLGALPERIKVVGSAKYEVAQRDPEAEARARAVLANAGIRDGQAVLLGGSTWPGEEAGLLDIYRELRGRHRDLVLALAPRHAERTPEVLRQVEARGLSALRRSRVDDGPAAQPPEVFIIDTTGELKNFYPFATVIFIGKSLTRHGGQNIIEPALCGKSIVVGPNMENFPVVIDDFRRAEAVVQVADAAGLKAAVADLLDHPEKRAGYEERAARLVRAKAGAVRQTVDLIEPLLR